jgi:Phospholipase_D-nuclease N-terminal
MSLLWLLLALLMAIVAVVTVVDVFGRHLGAAKTAGWILLVLIVPLAGPALYWIIRPTPTSEIEQIRLARAEMRSETERRPFG